MITEPVSIQDELTNAVWQEDKVEVLRLISKGADPSLPDSRGWTPLMKAANAESFELIVLLVEAGADVNTHGVAGETALHIAVDNSIDGTIQQGGMPGEEPTEIIEHLLRHGANVEAFDEQGNSPLDWAEGYRSDKIVSILGQYKNIS